MKINWYEMIPEMMSQEIKPHLVKPTFFSIRLAIILQSSMLLLKI